MDFQYKNPRHSFIGMPGNFSYYFAPRSYRTVTVQLFLTPPASVEMVAVPVLTPVTFPALSTVAIFVSEETRHKPGAGDIIINLVKNNILFQY